MRLLHLSFANLILAVAFISILWVSGTNCVQSAQPQSNINVVHPADAAKINTPGTFLLGSVPPGSELRCNGEPVKLNANGFFAHTVKLKPGINNFVLALSPAGAASAPQDQRLITIIKPQPRKPIPPGKLKIDTASFEPAQDLGVTAGDLIPLSVRATPQCAVTAKLGNHTVKLQPFLANAHSNGQRVHADLVTEYGVTYNNQTSSNADLYTGLYKVNPTDSWKDIQVSYEVLNQSGKIQQAGKAKLNTVSQPLPAHTISDHTIVRVGPGKGRVTPLVADVRLMVDGWLGSQQRCWLAPEQHVWIDRNEIVFDPNMQLPPQTVVRTINVVENDRDTQLRIPLDQRLPYRIEQRVNPEELTLKIYGATSDADWITDSVPGINSAILDHVSCKQSSDYVIEITAHLKNVQWGFWADYDDTTLVLHIRSAPHVSSTDLKGLTICIDPGHGGSEPGAIGPSGIREAVINLDIASKLARLLTEAGAQTRMTRTTDENVSLQDRPQFAVSHNADLLISVHNNALPDNRDPWLEHGISTYWYHPQAIKLAQSLKKPLVTELSLHDYGTFFENLALTRPSNMPACLVEVGFMTNPDEYAQLLDPAFRARAATALLHGIDLYVHSAAQQ
jgi:N-acetylmuramoyl-L-alanine amidase